MTEMDILALTLLGLYWLGIIFGGFIALVAIAKTIQSVVDHLTGKDRY